MADQIVNEEPLNLEAESSTDNGDINSKKYATNPCLQLYIYLLSRF